ncbi:ABC transporter ATP-binding protein [Pseudorhodoplanes sinuspersici]|uniref:ABC transporter ATP-binding protein n=1 Tax=Pseudorhodoplanes sinuspersici TaxID=1235591 RepID=A0A1W6ZT84_9HYPH|nr:ABC transporter ATP-binding protein [Pseudorhodoplanes sinuspersici]ARQ00331.1 ABC transporter ATP-binding protein [Pseudorhodoplanes sinuspersici]RKE67508.1 amino acid/amide ABC transporter ATP-binding protein 1 (HAAT family) [Pseudorhodoplanes sinuspersici]
MTALLELQGLTRRFGGLTAVDKVSFSLNEGEIVGLIGSNGAGKTTLVNLVTGHLQPTAGRIVFAGHDVTGKAPYHLARLGLVRTFQVVQPFMQLTALDNVAAVALFAGGAADMAAARQVAAAALERLGIGELAHRLPPHITLAQRKRLELAKALAAKPKLLFLDEVNAGLNSAEIDGVLTMIRAIAAEGVTIVIIEHLMKVVRGLCRRLVVLHQGALLADGPTDDVARDPAVIQAYLGTRGAAMLETRPS